MALKRAGRNKIKQLRAAYDLSSSRAADFADTVAKQADIIADCDAEIESVGLIARGGKNGAPYANPAIGIRNKAIELAISVEDKLQAFKKAETGKKLKLQLDDDDD